MFKRIISISIAAIMLLLSAPCTFAAPVESTPRSIEEILEEYHSRISEVTHSSDGIATCSNVDQQTALIKQETIAELQESGYDAYDVNPKSFEQVEADLHTDLESMGIDPQSEYIVVISGDPNEESGQGSGACLPASTNSYDNIGPSFQFTYNNRVHTMRYATVTKAQDPDYGGAKTANLLPDPSKNIEDVLNGILYFLADQIGQNLPFGTIASICGVKPININTTQDVTMILYAAVNYTRIFTQIYDEDHGWWSSYSSVDKARLSTFVSGHYYDAAPNAYQRIDETEKVQYFYSEHFSDGNWRKSNAAAAWRYGTARNEYMGDVEYYYKIGNKTNKFTFFEPFVGPAW